ncbi:hypothetical protein EB796_010885 [Bugula neritina]|uniref:Uncharacterized protein n=1 Tax=Bugula neritina TaxID=10212 RepID=A0A7J7JWK6_BUGNE|nr:hypothetical protein EB796_010885 [Bugula neritina]
MLTNGVLLQSLDKHKMATAMKDNYYGCACESWCSLATLWLIKDAKFLCGVDTVSAMIKTIIMARSIRYRLTFQSSCYLLLISDSKVLNL